jgi:hypothetical protein
MHYNRCLSYLSFIQIIFISTTMAAGRESNISPQVFRPFDPLQVSQESDRDIFSNLPPEYNIPLGIRTGNFYLYPELSVSESYADNIYFTRNFEKSDFITVVSPRLQYRSGWQNHALNFYGSMDYGHFANHQTEDFYDFSLGSDGIFDIKRDLNFYGSFFFVRQHELRGANNAAINGIEPTIFYVYSPNVGMRKQFNRLSFTLEANVDQFEFQNNQSILGLEIDNQIRNRREYINTLQLNYETQKNNTVFIRGNHIKRDYFRERDLNNFNRDSEGFDLVAGAYFNFSNLMYGNAFFGYMSRNFTDPKLKDISTPTFGLDLVWLPTDSLKLVANIIREARETIRTTSSSIEATAIQLSLSHELHHDLVAEYQFTALNQDYVGSSRVDYLYLAGINAKYMIDRGLFFSIGYDFAQRESSIPFLGYTENMLTANLEAHY